jgi:16S rRNA G966 N2-methylase RsmD
LANEFDVNWLAQKRDVFNFLKNTDLQFDLIFADPPYDLKNINEITPLVFQNTNLLHPDGVLIVEHSKRTDLSKHINFVDSRKYGNVNFSFFKHKNHE